MSFTKSLPLLAFILTTLTITSTHVATFTITNHCAYTVWGAATNGGQRIDPGDTWSFDVPVGTQSGRVWGRTNCNFGSDGRGSCQTGDCGGLLVCKPSVSGQPPLTLAEYTLNGGGGKDYYDISVTNGFNVPISFRPTNGACPSLQCNDQSCPDAYQFPTDDTKTKTCPSRSNYIIDFCP